jgi:hypothetical protein
MTADQALNALEVLSASVGKMWPASLTSPPFAKLPGVVNHCIKEIHRNTGHNWSMILSRHGGRFVALMTKLNEAGLSHKLVQPK